MRLGLKYEPTPMNVPRFAADIVQAARRISDVELDYSPASIQHVDEIIGELRQAGCTLDQVGETLFGFGCYVGEVFVRRCGGKWRNASELAMPGVDGFPVVELGNDSVANPIGKAFKRMENGEGDSLAYFYQVFSQGK